MEKYIKPAFEIVEIDTESSILEQSVLSIAEDDVTTASEWDW